MVWSRHRFAGGQFFLNPDVVTEKPQHLIIAGDAGEDALRICVGERTKRQIRGDQRTFAAQDPFIQDQKKL